MPSTDEATTELVSTYHDLNGNIEELHQDPSSLEFMRFVAKNRPFIVRGGCSTWPSVQKWNVAYLKQVMGNTPVKIAVTPHGNADSAVICPGGLMYFVKPLERIETFSGFVDSLQDQSLNQFGTLVKYSQAQNDNLRGEYESLYGDVEKDIRWASIALGQKPDAINLWIGNNHSTTALHRDNYENIYCQIIGSKDFVLLSSVETACINEQFLPGATFNSNMNLLPDYPPAPVPCAVWDPDEPNENTTKFSHLSRAIRVRLDPGDFLYLPACWYHKVSQRNSEEGICCSVNYWYDMDFEGAFHVCNAFIRNMAWGSAGET